MNRVFAYQADQLEVKISEARADAIDLRKRANELDLQADRDEAILRSLRSGLGR